MGVNGKQSSTVIFHDLSVVPSPRGDGALEFTPIVLGKRLTFEAFKSSRQQRLQALYGDSFTAYLEHEYPLISRNGDPLFTGDDRCHSCSALILSDSHRTFIFYHSPADMEGAPTTGGVPSEWRPCAEDLAIPGDHGPNRAGFWLNGSAKVQVHDGDDHGFWAPCFSYTVTRGGLPYSMWMCRRDIENPCDEEYLRSISS